MLREWQKQILERKVKTWQLLETAKVLVDHIIQYAQKNNIPLPEDETIKSLLKEVDRLIYDSRSVHSDAKSLKLPRFICDDSDPEELPESKI